MTPPIAEGVGVRVEFTGDLEVGYEEGETLLMPETPQAAHELDRLITSHPDSKVTVTEDDSGDVSVEGRRVPDVSIETRRSRVIYPTPIAEQNNL